MIHPNTNILIIYTGGTIGMIENTETGVLYPFDYEHMKAKVPELQQLKFTIETYTFDPLIDSSDMSPDNWKKIVDVIQNNYDRYDGFVILHGTDTMAYTASALSFMIQNLKKPIILTGSQLPISRLRTDGKENLITALEIAADKSDDGRPMVPEVCIYFQNSLMRGNRSSKVAAEIFNAFISPNYSNLADVGINIDYHEDKILHPDYNKETRFDTKMSQDVLILKIFPGITTNVIDSILSIKNLKGIVIETFGTGNAPTNEAFLSVFEKYIKKEISVVNVTQCMQGSVEMDIYATGTHLKNIGMISGRDMTTESAITKMMHLLAKDEISSSDFKKQWEKSISGEVSLKREK